MNSQPDSPETDEQLEALTEAAMMWEGRLEAPADFPGTLTEALAPIVAEIRRQSAADALRAKAKGFDNTARMFRDMSRKEGIDHESSTIYWVHANQARTDADALRKEADGIIAEGYEFTCADGWDQCENRVPDAGDHCNLHQPEDDEDRWSE